MEYVWQKKKLSVRAEVELHMGKKRRTMKESVFFSARSFLMEVIHKASLKCHCKSWREILKGKRSCQKHKIKISNPFQLHMHGMETDMGL